MAQSGTVCQSGHKTVKVVLHLGIQWEKNVFVRGNYLPILSPPHPVSADVFPRAPCGGRILGKLQRYTV